MVRTTSLTVAELTVVLTVALAVGAAAGALTVSLAPDAAPGDPTPTDAAVSTFDSPDEFRAYLDEADRLRGGSSVAMSRGGAQAATRPPREVEDDAAMEREVGDVADSDDGAVAPEATPAPQATPVEAEPVEDAAAEPVSAVGDRRVSGTNVQVTGIDEPDVLKTTADTFYYATDRRHRPVAHHDDRSPESAAGVQLIDVDDPEAPAVASRLNVTGELLLAGDTLLVLEADTLSGYDVSDRSDPELVWETDLEDHVVTARLYAGHVYLVTADRVDRDRPCPVEPLEDVEVPCTSIHHPVEPVPVDTTYTVTVLDPDDGSIADTTGFVGTAGQSVVYMSEGAVYLTYQQPVDEADLQLEFLLSTQRDRLDDETVDRLEEIRAYDLSPRAKRVEIEHTVESWLAGLDDTERREARRALGEDAQAWAEENKREFERTGIVRFDVRGAETAAPTVEAAETGTVPGHPLNQFSLNEHDGHLRIATTVRGAMGTDSANDVYVLDDSLEVTGSVQDMGLTERIYAVRFMGDEGYVVTFRQIDPFYVLDLSDPSDPTMEGELKLPGFSTYLHPLGEDRVLGIGEEDRHVKLVVFDVSDPTDPTIEDDRILDDRWSAVAESHHAFLHDERHGVFFLPTSSGGHVYAYDDGLERVASVETDGAAHRAAYLEDYLYVFGESSVTVVDERTWEETTRLELTE